MSRAMQMRVIAAMTAITRAAFTTPVPYKESSFYPSDSRQRAGVKQDKRRAEKARRRLGK